MATRARIGLRLSDDSILSVYHHWDGYPSWLGRILESHYNTKEKVEELIDGGDMSVCWTKERWTGKELAPYVKEIKEAEEYGPQHYSQRGEDCPPRLDPNMAAYADKERGEEYHYVYGSVDGEYTWTCIDMNAFDYSKDPETVSIPSGHLAC
tara:strand:- start:3195 stop:3650 length:456 start_codon:yes stop_codon:yes gene_type:complete